MTAIKTLLWIQLTLGLVGGYVAFAYVHWGAMSIAWTHGYKVELEKARQSPDFHQPSEIRGQSFDRVVESMESSARARGDVAFYWLITCGAAAALAALLLWMLRRVDQTAYANKAASPEHCSEPFKDMSRIQSDSPANGNQPAHPDPHPTPSPDGSLPQP